MPTARRSSSRRTAPTERPLPIDCDHPEWWPETVEWQTFEAHPGFAYLSCVCVSCGMHANTGLPLDEVPRGDRVAEPAPIA